MEVLMEVILLTIFDVNAKQKIVFILTETKHTS